MRLRQVTQPAVPGGNPVMSDARKRDTGRRVRADGESTSPDVRTVTPADPETRFPPQSIPVRGSRYDAESGRSGE